MYCLNITPMALLIFNQWMTVSVCFCWISYVSLLKIKVFVFTKPQNITKLLVQWVSPPPWPMCVLGERRDAEKSASGEEGQGHPFIRLLRKEFAMRKPAGPLCLLPARVASPTSFMDSLLSSCASIWELWETSWLCSRSYPVPGTSSSQSLLLAKWVSG